MTDAIEAAKRRVAGEGTNMLMSDEDLTIARALLEAQPWLDGPILSLKKYAFDEGGYIATPASINQFVVDLNIQRLRAEKAEAEVERLKHLNDAVIRTSARDHSARIKAEAEVEAMNQRTGLVVHRARTPVEVGLCGRDDVHMFPQFEDSIMLSGPEGGGWWMFAEMGIGAPPPISPGSVKVRAERDALAKALRVVHDWVENYGDCPYCVVGDMPDGHKEFCIMREVAAVLAALGKEAKA